MMARQLREINRHLLPSPVSYYEKLFPGIPRAGDWVKVKCPIHDDKTPSLSINLRHGGFVCRGKCNVKGDLIQFHMLRYDLNFVDACKSLGVWMYDN